jgi:hypothetical protein
MAARYAQSFRHPERLVDTRFLSLFMVVREIVLSK